MLRTREINARSKDISYTHILYLFNIVIFTITILYCTMLSY